MLPSKGYFSNILCPYSPKECSRPYCHFRHTKESQMQSGEEKTERVIKEVVKKTVNEVLSSKQIQDRAGQVNLDAGKIFSNVLKDIEHENDPEENGSKVPSYNPTPISELNRRHLPFVLPPSKPSYSNVTKARKVSNNFHIFPNLDCPKVLRNDSEPNQKTSFVQDKKFQKNLEPHENIGVSVDHSKTENISLFTYYSSALEVKEVHNNDITKDDGAERQDEINKRTLTSLDSTNKQQDVCSPDNGEHASVYKPIEHYNLIEIKEDTSVSTEEIANGRSNMGIEINNKHRKPRHMKHGDSEENANANKHDNSSKPLGIDDIDDNTSGEKRKHSLEVESTKKLKYFSDINVDETANTPCLADTEVLETISVHSSPSSSPSHESDEESKNIKESPPAKRKKNTLVGENVSKPTLPEALCERWKKARDTIVSKNKGNRKFKILPVSKVQLLLADKNRFSGKSSVNSINQKSSLPKANNETIEMNVMKTVIRKSRLPATTPTTCPKPIFEDSLKIPYYVRQQAIATLFDEFSKYCNPKEAHESSQKLELELSRRVHIIKTYRSAIAVAVLRIRKQKGLVFDRQVTKETLGSNEVASFANGWTMYKCFSEYLLTDEQYRFNGFPLKMKWKEGCAYIEPKARRSKNKKVSNDLRQICDNCSKVYAVDENRFPLEEYDCFYHWGKVRRIRVGGVFVDRFTCCGGDIDSDSCTNSKYHVCNLFNDDFLEGFVTTHPQKRGQCVEAAGIYGIDCEMCYTTRGVELARCTLVDLNGKTVYDKIVVPENPIIDYCTRFSGITEAIMKTATLRLKDIQRDLLGIVNENTILVGHSLENDMKVLRMFHKRFVDTSVVFPHKNGLPFKLSLKKIAKDLLNLTIQEKESGHDSYEDANACIQIVLWKVKEDAKKRKPRVIISLDSIYES